MTDDEQRAWDLFAASALAMVARRAVALGAEFSDSQYAELAAIVADAMMHERKARQINTASDLPNTSVESAGTWRVGRQLGRTLYVNNVVVGMVDTRELAEAIVERMNRDLDVIHPTARAVIRREALQEAKRAIYQAQHASSEDLDLNNVNQILRKLAEE